jgi:hypothetical protein
MRRLILLGLALLLGSAGLFAQATGQISGSVTDASAAVIPGASVIVTNQDTGVHHPVETNPAGEFIVPGLTPGTYEVSAEATGFQKAEKRDIVLQVGGKVRVEMVLQVAAATTSVEVTGTLTGVETETAAVSGVITGNQIANLSLPSRNFVALALMVPGAAPSNDLNTDSVGVNGNVEISFNGSRTVYNNWEIDGGNNSDQGSNDTLNTYPSLDAIAEFRVTTSNYGADVGIHSGASIQVSTKSGTRDWHGTAFEFLRNDALNANPFFVNRQIDPPGGNAPKSPIKRNEFGYTFGGPIYIPGKYNTNKDKTFFFWSQSWRRFRESEVVDYGVPTIRQRQGDFSDCLEGSPNYDERVVDDGCVFPSNADPVTGLLPSLDSNGVALMGALLPLPNSGPDRYVASSAIPMNWRQELIRVDHNFSDRTRLFVRYTQDAWEQQVANALWADSNVDTVKTDFKGPGKSVVLNFAHSFTPSLFSEFIMGYTVDHIELYAVVGASSFSKDLTRSGSGFSAPHIFSNNDSYDWLPSTMVSGGSQVDAQMSTGYFPWFNSNPIVTWKENLTWIKGKHTIKFGAFVERFRKNEQFYTPDTQGIATFSSDAENSTGNALADLLSGIMYSYEEGNRYTKGYYRYTAFEPYIQDDWKVTPRLTLNLGVRYSLYSRMKERYMHHPGFYPNLYDPAMAPQLDENDHLVGGIQFTQYGNGLVQCGVTEGVPPGCQTGEYKNIAPRFGFAWDPWGNGKTAIRGGAGVFFDTLNGNEAGSEAVSGGPPISYGVSLYNLDSWDEIGPGLLSPASMNTNPKHAPYPRSYQFSFTVQHQFTPNDLLSVGYVGNVANFLTRNREMNLPPLGLPHADQDALIDGADPLPYKPFQGFDSITSIETSSRSNYHSLQADFRHQVTAGLSFGAAYTWSHMIDFQSNQWEQWSVDEYNLNRWRGNASLDRRQMLVFNYVYDLPFFNNRTGWIKNSLGGWQVTGSTTFMNGTPISIGCGLSDYLSGVGGGVQCNTLGKQSGKSMMNDLTYGPTVQWFNVDAFEQPNLDQLYADNQPGMFGYGGRNTIIGPGINNWDLSLFKNFSVGERFKVQFRFENFNVWNHTQWRDVETGCSDAIAPGEVCGTAGKFGQVSSTWRPRIIQLGLKLLW